MAAEKHEDPWSAFVVDGKRLSERVEVTMDLAQSEVARSREIVSTASRTVARSRLIMQKSVRTKMRTVKQQARNPIFRPLPVKE